MEKIMRPVWAEIDLDILANNMKNIKKLAGNKEVIAVVKADAYGHGALDVAPCLLENGASRLAVAMLTEAIELRNNNIKAPIMILGYTPLDGWRRKASKERCFMAGLCHCILCKESKKYVLYPLISGTFDTYLNGIS